MNLLKNFTEIKNLIFTINNIYPCANILIIFFLDRFSKLKIVNNFSDQTHYINNFVNLDLIWNTGIGFGLLSYDSNFAYKLITILIFLIILILFYVAINSKKIDKLIFSIILGGALGNFYDRLIFNAVPDFIDLHYNNFHWFTFNVADIFITFGIIVFLIKGFFVENS